MKLLISLLLFWPTILIAQPVNVGGTTIVVPERFNSIGYMNENFIAIRDPKMGSFINIRVDRKKMSKQHFAVLEKVHAKLGSEFKDVECVKSCKAKYTEYKYKGRERFKSVYLVDAKDAYYQIESDMTSMEEGREMTKAIFNQMIQKHIFYIE